MFRYQEKSRAPVDRTQHSSWKGEALEPKQPYNKPRPKHRAIRQNTAPNTNEPHQLHKLEQFN
jgi:hypothetical protein